jgi:hypothetical protein
MTPNRISTCHAVALAKAEALAEKIVPAREFRAPSK